MRRGALAALALTFSTLGCTGTKLQEHATITAQRQLNCQDPTLRRRDARTWVAECSGRSAVVMCARNRCVNLTALAAQRFSREYECSTDVQATEISNHVFKVSGCEKQANYVCKMTNLQGRCIAEGAATGG